MNDGTLKHTNTCEHKFTNLFYSKSKRLLKQHFHFIVVDIVASVGQYDHDKICVCHELYVACHRTDNLELGWSGTQHHHSESVQLKHSVRKKEAHNLVSDIITFHQKKQNGCTIKCTNRSNTGNG